MNADIGPTAVSVAQIEPVCRRWRIREFAVFGSTARGDTHGGSDLDFLVEFEPDAVVGFLGLAALQRELAELLHRRVDIVTKNGLNPLIREEFLSQRRILYAA